MHLALAPPPAGLGWSSRQFWKETSPIEFKCALGLHEGTRTGKATLTPRQMRELQEQLDTMPQTVESI